MTLHCKLNMRKHGKILKNDSTYDKTQLYYALH